VRPYPSLRITFTSAALRIPGLLQSRFLDRVGGPLHVREGIYDALSQGVGVTAKISWLTASNAGGDRSGLEGKPRWIHCTPLLGSDAKVGVWMVGMCAPLPLSLRSSCSILLLFLHALLSRTRRN